MKYVMLLGDIIENFLLIVIMALLFNSFVATDFQLAGTDLVIQRPVNSSWNAAGAVFPIISGVWQMTYCLELFICGSAAEKAGYTIPDSAAGQKAMEESDCCA